MNTQQLRDTIASAKIFPTEVLEWVKEQNLWNIWVPEAFGGLECSFTEGLQKLQQLAKIDGTLGWTVTLCSGANFFIGNLNPETAERMFQKGQQTILGGSGGLFGTAEKSENGYMLNGTWKYATGANYLTHFTLNAQITENAEKLTNPDGSPKFLSFVIPAKNVEIIEDWDTIGMQASVTHSFKVENVEVDEDLSFVYNEFHLPQDIFKIHFSLFADLTLWVNYLGMAQHFVEEAEQIGKTDEATDLKNFCAKTEGDILALAKKIETQVIVNPEFTEDFIKEVHQLASVNVKEMSQKIIELYPLLGVKASTNGEQLNVIFRDYFTATQHHIFSRK
ncbi:MAG: acyl-CoA dehydrogenase [Cytophagaceae bacterium]|nr:acyl-CoA dehydrogenase [Cytophagaceae bacterium]|tara:strand:- start:3680 stop:4684 length:1005 start_codon:yes stop_codon:yes gene_type:complete